MRKILQLPSSRGSSPENVHAKEMEAALHSYMRRACDSFDLTKNVEVSSERHDHEFALKKPIIAGGDFPDLGHFVRLSLPQGLPRPQTLHWQMRPRLLGTSQSGRVQNEDVWKIIVLHANFVQVPQYVIEYETRSFKPDLHVRFHSSNPCETTIRTYLWPALKEGKTGPCVHKAVVLT